MGVQPYMNEVYVEGIPMTNAAAQGETRNLAYSVSVESVDQFQVQTNNSPAECQGQGIENYTIKSGSNQFHGAGYEYFRNTVLDARGYFPTFRPPEKQNQFGARIGGYIFKDKLFFFGNYDGYRYRASSNPTAQSVPNAAFLAGDFSALIPAGTDCNVTPIAGCIFDPLTTTAARPSARHFLAISSQPIESLQFQPHWRLTKRSRLCRLRQQLHHGAARWSQHQQHHRPPGLRLQPASASLRHLLQG
jgi:hypothetical protein